MTDKTPLGKLIEYCEKCKAASSVGLVKSIMDGIAKEAKSLLHEEKQAILDAIKSEAAREYWEGQKDEEIAQLHKLRAMDASDNLKEQYDTNEALKHWKNISQQRLESIKELKEEIAELKEGLDAAREDEVVKFEKWRIDNGYNIRNNGKYAIYYMGQGNHTLNELYKLYKNR